MVEKYQKKMSNVRTTKYHKQFFKIAFLFIVIKVRIVPIKL